MGQLLRLRRLLRRGCTSALKCLLGGALCVAALDCGDAEDPSPQQQAEGVPPYPEGLSADSTPTDVAQALIRFLDERDKTGLAGLVAYRAAAEEIDAIFRKHGRRSSTSDAAAANLAVGGWLATYATWQRGGTRVAEEKVNGDEATVLAAGELRNGRPARLKIRLVREGGVWRVLPGLQTLGE